MHGRVLSLSSGITRICVPSLSPKTCGIHYLREGKPSFINRAPFDNRSKSLQLESCTTVGDSLFASTVDLVFLQPGRSKTPNSDMDRQKPQFHTFQVLWCSNAHNDRPPPLQMRSFTSDSYRALKEREQKKRQQWKAVSKKWNKAQCGDVPGELASSGTALEMPRSSEWNDSICISKSTNSRKPSAAQEDAQVQLDDTLRRLHPLGNSSSTVVGTPSEAVARSLPVDISNTMSISALESACSEVVPSKELDCGIIQEADVGRSATPANELDIIIPDDADASIEQPGNGCLDEVDFVCQAPSPMTPIYSSNPEPCERQGQGDNIALPKPVCLQPNAEHMPVAAMSIERYESILADALPVTQSHVSRNDNSAKSSTRRVGLGWKGEKFTSALQIPWTNNHDEYLLHLRDVAQLDWRRVVKYFPEATPSDVKRRYRELIDAGTTCDTGRTQQMPRARGRKSATRFLTSSSSKTVPMATKNHSTLLHGSATPVMVKRKIATPRCRRTTKQDNARRTVTDPSLTACDDAFQRTSRCGRTIRHPFRYRPTEGYIQIL